MTGRLTGGTDAIRIEPVDALDARVVFHDWAFPREQVAAIEANWQGHLAAGRKLWDGEVLLCSHAAIVLRDGKRVFESRHFVTRFKAFVAFRDFGFPDPTVRNCFAMAALRGADGPFLLGRMAAHTANAGMMYFPAGTPDPTDIDGDKLDLAGSIMRELAEETGLTGEDVVDGQGYAIVFERGRIACLREMRAHADAATVIARVKGFIEREPSPEIVELVGVAGEAEIDRHPMPPFLPHYLRAKFAGG